MNISYYNYYVNDLSWKPIARRSMPCYTKTWNSRKYKRDDTSMMINLNHIRQPNYHPLQNGNKNIGI